MKVMIKFILIIAVFQTALAAENNVNAENASQKATLTENTTETTTPATPEKPVELPTAAPLKGLEWVKGGPVTIEPKKVYVIEFWATWCAPCKTTIPHLTEIQKKYKDKGLTVIGISNESKETAGKFVKKMGEQMDYTVAVDVQGFVQRNYMNAFGAQGIPHAFIINRNGKIAWQGHPAEDMDTIIELVVAGTFDPTLYAKQKAEAEALQRQCMAWYTDYFQKIQANGGLNEETKQIAANFIEKAPVEGLNAMAWNILTTAKEPNRDLETALKAAEKANQIREGKDPAVLEVYSLALFENKKIPEAIQALQKTIDLAKDYPQAQKELKKRLEEYKAAEKEKQIITFFRIFRM